MSFRRHTKLPCLSPRGLDSDISGSMQSVSYKTARRIWRRGSRPWRRHTTIRQSLSRPRAPAAPMMGFSKRGNRSRPSTRPSSSLTNLARRGKPWQRDSPREGIPRSLRRPHQPAGFDSPGAPPQPPACHLQYTRAGVAVPDKRAHRGRLKRDA